MRLLLKLSSLQHLSSPMMKGSELPQVQHVRALEDRFVTIYAIDSPI
jgi:hypothetical protein